MEHAVYWDLNALSERIVALRAEGKRIVWTNGCFDIMHPGHMRTFAKCRELGDVVVVGLNGDGSPYWKTKPGRPINDERFRSIMLSSLRDVDFVYLFDDETPEEPVRVLRPDIVLKGGDYIQESIRDRGIVEEGVIDLTEAYRYMLAQWIEKFREERGYMPEWAVAVKNGGRVVVVPTLAGYSTTSIVQKLQN